MHYKPDRPRCVAIAKNFCNLPVCHHTSAGNLAHEFVDMFAVISFVLPWCELFSSESSQDGAGRRAVPAPARNS